jgi:cell division protein FtsW (lipid II flippase)
MFWLVLILKYLVLFFLILFLLQLIRVLAVTRLRRGSPISTITVLDSSIPEIRAGKKWILDRELFLGRGAGCQAVIPDPYVSSKHARIFYQNGQYYVTDLGSTNGTILDGDPLTAPKPLRNGACLQLGRVRLTFDSQIRRKYNKGVFLPFFPGLILSAGMLELYREQVLTAQEIPLLLVVIVFLTVSSLVAQKRENSDPLFVHLTGVLSALGLIFIFRVNPYFGVRQGYWILAGVVLFWFVQFGLTEYRCLHDFKYIFMVLALLFLVLTILFGDEAGGARSWLTMGSFRFQPSEFAKIFMVIFLAGYLDENKEILRQGTKKIGRFYVPDWPYLGPLLVACGLSLLLLVFQKDLGMALVFFSIFLLLVYVATGRISYLMLGLCFFSVGALFMYYLFPHVQERLLIFLNPWQYADSSGYQIIQSLFALASGGIIGLGLGSGFPDLIPAVHTDFVFSLLGEELGLLGILGVIGIFFVFVISGLRLALDAPDDFGKLLAFGFSSLLALQALIIIGGVTKLIPLTGIPLPFLSYGGSSYISNSFLVGVLARISMERDLELQEADPVFAAMTAEEEF